MSHIGFIWIFSEDLSRWVRCLLDFLVDFHVILEFPFYIFEILNSGLADGLCKDHLILIASFWPFSEENKDINDLTYIKFHYK